MSQLTSYTNASSTTGNAYPDESSYRDAGAPTYSGDYHASAGTERNDDRHSSTRTGARDIHEIPGRTLFVRNVQYNVPERTLRGLFERYGVISRFFNLIDKRGMAFITYEDQKEADRAKEELQGYVLGGRPIDIHYSIPREQDRDTEHSSPPRTSSYPGVVPDERNNGTLFVSVRNCSKQISNHDVKRHFERWGDVREVRDCRNSPTQKFVEFFDRVAAEVAFRESQGMSFADGVLDIKYAFHPSSGAKPAKEGERGRPDRRDLRDSRGRTDPRDDRDRDRDRDYRDRSGGGYRDDDADHGRSAPGPERLARSRAYMRAGLPDPRQEAGYVASRGLEGQLPLLDTAAAVLPYANLAALYPQLDPALLAAYGLSPAVSAVPAMYAAAPPGGLAVAPAGLSDTTVAPSTANPAVLSTLAQLLQQQQQQQRTATYAPQPAAVSVMYPMAPTAAAPQAATAGATQAALLKLLTAAQAPQAGGARQPAYPPGTAPSSSGAYGY